MSSLLKALKQQQSPLVNQGSDLDPALVDRSRSTKSFLLPLLTLVVVVLLTLVIWLAIESFDAGQKTTVEPVPKPINEYQLGDASDIPNISWAMVKKPEPKPVQQDTVITSRDDGSEREPLDLSSVSADLLSKFEQAIAETNTDSTVTNERSITLAPPLEQLSVNFQQQVPAFTYDGHMYVSRQSDRWIELNKQRYYIGDYVQGLKVERIEPQHTVLSINGKAFSVEALRDWQ